VSAVSVLLLALVVIMASLVMVATVGLVAAYPLLRAVRARQRVELERRLAEWQVRRIARQAMLRLLDEARRAEQHRW
jgi:hypothetical protein